MTAIDMNSVMTKSDTVSGTNLFSKISSWLLTTSHHRIGRLMVSVSLLWTVAVVVVGVVLGVERISSSTDLIDPGSTTQLFSIFRVGLIFGSVAPMTLGIALAIVPMQIGSQVLAFARGAAFGAYLWFFGMIIVGVSYIGNGGPGGGDPQMVDLFILGLGLVIAGLLVVSASIATTILTSRRAGMTLIDAPIFVWSSLVTSISLILTLPVMAGALIYVAVDHSYERSTFGATDGINAWIGWALTSPQIFLLAVSTLGVLAQIVGTMVRGRQPLRGGLLIGIGVMSTALIGTVTQSFYSLQLNGNLSDVAKSLLPFLLFNALPMLGVLIVLGLCLLAMKNEKAKPSASFVLAFFGVGMVLTGMLGNVLLRINDLKLSNTVFEEAVLVYVGYGVVLSSLGAIAYFGPRIWGRKMPTMPVIGLGLIGVLGVVFAALPYYIAGFTDQPAGSISGQLGDNSQIWNSVATAGQTIFLVFVVAFVGLVIKSSRSGEIADEAIFETVQANS
ncbi:cytochrome c oxidase subunit 1 [Acidimicrobiaceae bacterium]|nr:cytochrome c oxidase subunit 1 [Acidimicrobiaceae bacterium]